MATSETFGQRLMQFPLSVRAALMRIGRRIGEGFQGEIVITVERGGIQRIRWTQTEHGDVIKEELG